MSMIKCPECKKKISDKAKTCPHCGAPIPDKSSVSPTLQKKTRKSGCLIFIVVVAIFIFIGSNMNHHSEETESEPQIVFDAARFIVEEDGQNRPMHEAEVINLIGEPQSIDEWNYTTALGLQYPIRSLSYDDGNYVYEFNNDYLLRIQIFEPFNFENRDNFISMFNLTKYVNTEIEDKNINYHAYNCGVADLWLMDISDATIGTTYITYFSGVFDSY